MNLGMSVGTSSGVANRAENEARQKEDRFAERAGGMQTGLSAVPGIAQGASKAIGQVVQQANNVNSTENLSQVLNEASTGGLLTPEESKLIGNQMGTPEGNSSAKQLMYNVLPSRRADQKAVEFISQYPGDRIIEIKRTQEPAKRQELVNKLVRDIQLDAAESEDEATMGAIMKRVEGMFGVKSDTTSKYLSLDDRLKLNEDKHTKDRALATHKGEISEGLITNRSDESTYKDASKVAVGQAKSSASFQNLRNNWVEKWTNEESGTLDLIGLTPNYLSEASALAKGINAKEGTEEYKNLMIAKEQQGEFFGFLNKYIKDLSGAAVTTGEAKRMLVQFGLGDFTQGIIPSETANSINLSEIIKRGVVENASALTPQLVLELLNALGNDINQRRGNLQETYAATIRDEKLVARLSGMFAPSEAALFPAATEYNKQDFGALQADEIARALKI